MVGPPGGSAGGDPVSHRGAQAAGAILEKGNPEDSLIKYAEHLQEFQDFAVNNTGEEDFETDLDDNYNNLY